MKQETRDNYRDALQRPLQRAIARGEIAAEQNLNVIQELALPVLLHRAMWNDTIDSAYVVSFVDEVLMRLLTAPVPLDR